MRSRASELGLMKKESGLTKPYNATWSKQTVCEPARSLSPDVAEPCNRESRNGQQKSSSKLMQMAVMNCLLLRLVFILMLPMHFFDCLFKLTLVLIGLYGIDYTSGMLKMVKDILHFARFGTKTAVPSRRIFWVRTRIRF